MSNKVKVFYVETFPKIKVHELFLHVTNTVETKVCATDVTDEKSSACGTTIANKLAFLQLIHWIKLTSSIQIDQVKILHSSI